MKPSYPDLEWYSGISERKNLVARCPFATVNRCPRYFESVALLSDQGITAGMDQTLQDRLQAKWEQHDLWPPTAETAASISGGEVPNSFSNFCPEVIYDTFKMFASLVIRFHDEIDQASRERYLTSDGASPEKDWRWRWQHVEPMHYSECPIYSKLVQERIVSQINFHGPVSGQVNVAGETINAPSSNVSLAEILTKIESSDASPVEKAAAKSKLAEFLAHPLVVAIVGSLSSGAVGG